MHAGYQIDILDAIFKELMVYDCNLTKIRLGNEHDGGYVVAQEICQNTRHIYAFGVGGDVSFELNFVDKFPRLQKVNLYDPTIDSLPEDHPKFCFYRQGIGYKHRQKHCTINHIPDRSLLKMDIEGGEWTGIDWLYNRDLLKHFDQIVLEIHLLHVQPPSGLSPYFTGLYQDLCDETNGHLFPAYRAVLHKINRFFRLVHIHANNSLPVVNVGGRTFPPLLELTFVQKGFVKDAKEAAGGFPVVGLDSPNKGDRPDVEDYYPWG